MVATGTHSLLSTEPWARAASAADRANVRLREVSSVEETTEAAALFVEVWRTSPQSPPFPPDLLRSLAHAGSSLVAAYDRTGAMTGAAVAVFTSTDRELYSLIAGVRSGSGDSGVGFALKLHQRAWALDRGMERILWTFDPLVSRNARFNLSKLGARARDYERNFYGAMADGINGSSESDRLVAVWSLATPEGAALDPAVTALLEVPDYGSGDIRALGPDGEPAVVKAAGAVWCRVPKDIVELRTHDPRQAEEWRVHVRDVLTGEFSEGLEATGFTRSGWYRLTAGGTD